VTGAPPSLLASAPLFAALEPDERAELARGMVERRYADGDAIIRQNGLAEGVFLIESGRVSISKALPGGGMLPLAEHGAGSVFGEMALIGRNVRRSANGHAVGDVVSWFMPSALVQAALRQLRPSSLHLLRELGRVLAGRRASKSADIAAHLAAAPDLFSARALAGESGKAPAPFNIAAFLHKLPACAAMDDDVRSALLAAGQIETLPRSVALASPALIVSGAVRVGLPHGKGLYQLEVLGPGRWAGAGRLIAASGHPAQLVTSEASVLLSFDPAALKALWSGEDATASQLAQSFNADLARGLDALGAVEARIAAMLRTNALAA
jgi:CRP/FNR family transcriptional regulator, cyclic AMP receptor protein